MPCLESPFDRRQFLFGTAVFATGDCSRLPNSAKDFGSGGVIGSTEKKLGRPWQVLSDCTELPVHLDSWSVPDTEFGSENTINLKVTIHEGPQYRMGKLEVIAPKELAEKITAQWALSDGSVFDRTYPEKFLQDHRHLFPSSLQPNHTELA